MVRAASRCLAQPAEAWPPFATKYHRVNRSTKLTPALVCPGPHHTARMLLRCLVALPLAAGLLALLLIGLPSATARPSGLGNAFPFYQKRVSTQQPVQPRQGMGSSG
jgi:hypothetical protein